MADYPITLSGFGSVKDMPTTFRLYSRIVPFKNVQIVLKILTKISPFGLSHVKLEHKKLVTRPFLFHEPMNITIECSP